MILATSWWVLDFRVVAVFVFSMVTFNLCNDIPLRPKEMVIVLEEGKRQYNLIQARTSLPSFGGCWKDAVNRLHSGCQHLDDSVQSELALGFANCFLEGAGLPKHECKSSDREDRLERELCLKTMSDKAFIAYTEFFTHTQSMCFFIMSQVWHELTEKTIDRLSTSAADVARQLEASEEVQEELLQHQRKSVVIQQELLDNGISLGSLLHESRDSLNLIFSEFRTTKITEYGLSSPLHSSVMIVGEISWVDSIIFYIPSFVFIYFLTSAQRTASARIPALLVLVVSGLSERAISHFLLSDGADASSFEPVDVINERLSWWAWFVRRFAIALNILLISVTLYRFQDREEVLHELLQQIRCQNEQLLNHILGEVGKATINSSSKSQNPDDTDGFGYMPVLTTSTSSLSGTLSTPTIMGSPSTSRFKPVITINQIGRGYSLERTPVDIPTANSAFKPIKNESKVGISESSNSSGRQVDAASTPLEKSSTPRSKGGKKVNVESSSPATSRYNLRKSKLSATSPV